MIQEPLQQKTVLTLYQYCSLHLAFLDYFDTTGHFYEKSDSHKKYLLIYNSTIIRYRNINYYFVAHKRKGTIFNCKF